MDAFLKPHCPCPPHGPDIPAQNDTPGYSFVMRSDANPIQVLRNPLAQCLLALRAQLAQNQLRLAFMAAWGARAEAPERAQATGGVYLAASVAAGGALAGA